MDADFEKVIEFHGHACPGIAYGIRASQLAKKELIGQKASDEETVAIVENDSCAVDAVQVLTGCTFGKGNLIFKDFGKQVYTFVRRPTGEAIRIAVTWEPPPESEKEKELWALHIQGDKNPAVLEFVRQRKSRKIQLIMEADEDDLFTVDTFNTLLPKKARIFPTIRCSTCGEKVMEPRARIRDGQIICLPCFSDE